MDSSQAAGGGGGNSVMISQSTDQSPMESSATTADTPIDDPKQNLTEVINSIRRTLGILHQLYLTVSSYNVPMEVLNLIDDGKNPDEFTRDMLNACISKNQITKGKTDTFKNLRKHLEELEQAFPDEVEAYREIRAASAAETKRLAQSQSGLLNGDVKVKTEM